MPVQALLFPPFSPQMSITPHTEAWSSQISEAWAPWTITTGFLCKQLGLTLFTALSSMTRVLGGQGGEQAACFLLTLASVWVRMLKEWKVTLTVRGFAYTFVKTTKNGKEKAENNFHIRFFKASRVFYWQQIMSLGQSSLKTMYSYD